MARRRSGNYLSATTPTLYRFSNGEEELLVRFFKFEGCVKGAGGVEHLVLGYDAGDANLGGGYHLDVNVIVGEGAKHFGSVAGRVKHSRAHDAYFGEVAGANYLAASQFLRDLLHDFQGGRQVGVFSP